MSQVNKSITAFISAAQQVTGNDANGTPVARTMASVEYTYIGELLKLAYKNVTEDITTMNAAEIATWEFGVGDPNSSTHIDELFPPDLANKLKVSPHNDTCIVISSIDTRIQDHYNWVQVNGSPRDSLLFILKDKVYVVPSTKADDVLEAAATFAALDNRSTLYEAEGSCSSGQYTDSTTCIANSATWSSSVDPEEISDITAKYSALINGI